MQYLVIWIVLGLVGIVPAAQAYIGPGPGLSMLGPLFALLTGVVVALLMILAYPLRLLWKRHKAKAQSDRKSS